MQQGAYSIDCCVICIYYAPVLSCSNISDVTGRFWAGEVHVTCDQGMRESPQWQRWLSLSQKYWLSMSPPTPCELNLKIYNLPIFFTVLSPRLLVPCDISFIAFLIALLLPAFHFAILFSSSFLRLPFSFLLCFCVPTRSSLLSFHFSRLFISAEPT
jgi:hypothetical protein